MTDPLPLLDPYKALGLDKDATSQHIKTAYRKAALRCHPDKTNDKAKVEEFHRIQQAYDLLGDDDKRKHYDNTVKLAQLKRDLHNERSKYAPSTTRGASYSAAYSYSPRSGTTEGWSSKGPSRFEERRPKGDSPQPSPTRSARADPFDRAATDNVSARKYETYESTPRKSAPQSSSKSAKAESIRSFKSDKASAKEKEKERADRADVKKQKEREMMRERGRKYGPPPVESDSSDDDAYPRRSRAAPAPRPQPVPRRSARDARRSDEDSAYEDETYRRYKAKEDFIRGYTGGRTGPSTVKGSPPRETRRAASPPPSSFRQPQPEPSETRRSSTGSARPSLFRRSSSSSKNVTKESVKPASAPRRSSKTDYPEPERSRGFPSFLKSSTAPVESLRNMTRDSARGRSDDRFDRYDEPGRTRLNRADTMPARKSMDQADYEASRSGARAADARPARPERSESDRTLPRQNPRRADPVQPAKSSGLRTHAETHNDSGYSTSNSPNEAAPPPFPEPTSKQYYYGAGAQQTATHAPAATREAPQSTARTARRSSSPPPAPPPNKSERYVPRREESYREQTKYSEPRYTADQAKYAEPPKYPTATAAPDERRAPPLSRSAKTTDPAATARRPSISRTNSQRGSGPAAPTLGRTQTMPAHYSSRDRDGMFDTSNPFSGGVSNGKDGQHLFGEQKRSQSPEPMSPGSEMPTRSQERMPRYEKSPPRRAYTDVRDRPNTRAVPLAGVPMSGYGKKYDANDVVYSTTPPGLSRRSSNARPAPPPTSYTTYEPRRRGSSSGGGLFRRPSSSRKEGLAY